MWDWVHKWSSLICTLFLLMLCITGLPLTFHDEIDSLLNSEQWQPKHPNGPRLSIDEIITVAKNNRPGETPIYVSFDTDRPVVNVTTGPSADAQNEAMHFASFDATSGEIVPHADKGDAVMEFILRLHTDMFLGITGMLILAFMGLMFIVATISGIVIYKRFMRNLDFGTIRANKARRLKWLDYHNFLGIVTAAWVLIVGLTGVINALEKPILDVWRSAHLSSFIQSQQNAIGNATQDNEPQTAVVHEYKPRGSFTSLDDAILAAKKVAPDMVLQFVAYPGSEFSTSEHYAIFLHGDTPATKPLMAPVLVHASTGEVAGLSKMPWYMQALSISRPLHFGDYGSTLLKVMWLLLNLMTIGILTTGVYLWLRKHKQSKYAATKHHYQIQTLGQESGR